MTLRRGDDFPLHQTQGSIGHAGSDRTFGRRFVESGDQELVLGFAGAFTTRVHDRILSGMLEALIEGGWR